MPTHPTPTPWTRRAPALVASAGLAAAIMTLGLPTSARAQALTERTPSLFGSWVGSPWMLHFQFAHRFQTAGDANVSDIFGDAEIVNYPTFDLSLGLPGDLMTGVRYSSSSFVSFDQPNEWQPYLKWALLQSRGRSRAGLAITGAWNGANESLDGELAGQIHGGPLFALAAVRGFTDLYGGLADPGSGEALALAGGVGIRLNRYLTLAGDVSDVVTGGELDGESPTPGWSAGLHIGIPYTPHTFSIMATNVTSGTLQGSSGVPAGFPNDVYWGFELTVPFSGFARWGQILDPDPGDRETNRRALARGDAVVEIDISGVSFRRKHLEIPVGTTVRWVNRDPVAHTSTADDGTWSSPAIGPGETFEYTFTRTGEFGYHCVPHPFMTATIVVTRS